MTNIAMEHDPFIDDFPMKASIYSGFSMAMLNNQMVSSLFGIYHMSKVKMPGQTQSPKNRVTLLNANVWTRT